VPKTPQSLYQHARQEAISAHLRDPATAEAAALGQLLAAIEVATTLEAVREIAAGIRASLADARRGAKS
jgi:hypothetical protein